MQIQSQVTIDRPAQTVWEVLGNQFGQAHQWTSLLYHSESMGRPIAGQVCESRACNIKGMGLVNETIREFNPETFTLKYEVTKGFPFFVKTGFNTWRLESEGNSTRVLVHAEIKTQGLLGTLMAPLLKMQMTGMVRTLGEELKFYVENGKPHPRKVSVRSA